MTETIDYKDKYLRAVAEMENMKKRLEKERLEITKFASEKIFRDLLSVMDALESALELEQNLGIEQTRKILITLFYKNGVTPISAMGEQFNPNLHSAIDFICGDGEQVIVKEYIKGYLLNGRLLRASEVCVKG
jgi:molecular chaperone GrpE